jgi:DNA-binding transcriptional ArsR family regulator
LPRRWLVMDDKNLPIAVHPQRHMVGASPPFAIAGAIIVEFYNLQRLQHIQSTLLGSGAPNRRRTREVCVPEPLHRFKAEFFKALAHPTRIRILELLRGTERTVSELQSHLDMDPSSVSQQLAVLRAKNVVQTRKAGTSVYYTVRDPQVYILLDAAREIFNNHLTDLQAMLEQQRVEDEAFPPATSAAAASPSLVSTSP